MRDKKRKSGMLRSLAHSTMHMAQTVTYTNPAIKIGIDGEVFIENCSKITAYNENRIAFQVGERVVEIRGDDLVMHSLDNAGVLVRGRVHAVEFFYP